MTTAAILAFGLACAAVCAGLSWYSLSMNAIQWRLRRLGIPVDVKIDDLSEGTRDAYMRYLARQQSLAIPAALTGIAALILLTIVWSKLPWMVTAACFGWVAWALNDKRLRQHAS